MESLTWREMDARAVARHVINTHAKPSFLELNGIL